MKLILPMVALIPFLSADAEACRNCGVQTVRRYYVEQPVTVMQRRVVEEPVTVTRRVLLEEPVYRTRRVRSAYYKSETRVYRDGSTRTRIKSRNMDAPEVVTYVRQPRVEVQVNGPTVYETNDPNSPPPPMPQ